MFSQSRWLRHMMQVNRINRRRFITLLSGAAAWPFAARAQQPALPVIGFVNAGSLDGYRPMVAAFRRGLQETGYAEGRDVTIEYRWAEGQNDRLPAIMADLVHRHVTVIAATSTTAALAAKAATATIPIVFEIGSDPIRLGLVASLSRPGGNITGTTQLGVELAPKRLEVLHELLPTAHVMALLVNPTNRASAELSSKAVQSAAETLGLKVHVLNAETEHDFDGVFASLIQLRAGGLVLSGGDPLFAGRSQRLAALALRHSVPAIGANQTFVAAGGLAGYSASIVDAYHLTGVYTARILKGEKPSELPVQQSTKVELFLNLKTAKALDITVPLSLLGRADEVIE
jgi:putative tryptophan/tyrosine transport system substrate-binding protein